MFHQEKKKEKELGTAWMDFYINVRFPIVIALSGLTILSNLGNSYIANNNGYTFYAPSYYALSILFNIILLVANILVYRAMKTKSLDAVSENFALMILWTFFFTILQFLSTEMWLSLVITPIICSLWVVPNTIYFNKRKHLFSQDFYDIKREAYEREEKQEKSVNISDVNFETKTTNEQQQTNTDLQLDSSKENTSSEVILLGPSTATNISTISTQSSENKSAAQKAPLLENNESQKGEQERSSVPEGDQHFCTKCGERLKSGWRRCPSCGKRMPNPKIKALKNEFTHKTSSLALFVFCAAFAVLTIILLVFNYNKTEQVLNLTQQVTELESEIQTIENSRKLYKAMYERIKNNSNIQEGSTDFQKVYEDYTWLLTHIAFVTEDSEYYHSYECGFLDNETIWAYNIEAVKSQGYQPHSYCCDVFE